MKRNSRTQKSVVSLMAGIYMVMSLSNNVCFSAPSSASIQGLLENQDGSPLIGSRVYRVRFYDAETAGSQVGSDITGNVEVSNAGRFNIVITPPVEILSLDSVWYELSVDSASTPDNTIDDNDVFAQRVKLNSVPFALQADKAEQAAQVDHIHTTPDGKVGIGTNSPEKELHVEGAGFFNNPIDNRPAVIARRNDSAFTDPTVGQAQLRIENNDTTTNNLLSVLDFYGLWHQNNGANFIGGNNGARIAAQFDNFNSPAADLLFLSRNVAGTLFEKMRITSGGNVGIATINPKHKLHVEGTAFFNNTTDSGSAASVRRSDSAFTDPTTGQAQLSVENIDTTTNNLLSGIDFSTLWHQNNGANFIGGNNGARIVAQFDNLNSPAADLLFLSRGEVNQTLHEKMRITSDGKIGIGTPNPQYKLDVFGSAAAKSLTLDQGVTIGSGYSVTDRDGNGMDTEGNGDLKFYVGGNSSGGVASDKVIIKGNGRVGIGQPEPQQELHVNGDALVDVLFSKSQEIGGNPLVNPLDAVMVFHHHGVKAHQLSYRSGSFYLEQSQVYGSDSVPNLYVGGKIGVGTTSPSAKLDVNGTLKSGTHF